MYKNRAVFKMILYKQKHQNQSKIDTRNNLDKVNGYNQRKTIKHIIKTNLQARVDPLAGRIWPTGLMFETPAEGCQPLVLHRRYPAVFCSFPALTQVYCTYIQHQQTCKNDFKTSFLFLVANISGD